MVHLVVILTRLFSDSFESLKLIKVTANTIFERTLWDYLMAILTNPVNENVDQSAFAAKSPNLMFAKCTTPMIYA